MSTIHVIFVGVVSSLFAGLLGFFFSSITQRKQIKKTVDDVLKNHLKINHKYDTREIIVTEIQEYSKEVNYKFDLHDKSINELKESNTDVKKNLHNISLAVAFLVTKQDGDPTKYNL